MSSATTWDRRPNVVHWQWAKQGPSKFKCNSLFIKSFRGHKLSNIKVQLSDLASCLWPTLVGLLLAKTIGLHYEIIVKYSFDFFFTKLLFVHAIYEKWYWEKCHYSTSFRYELFLYLRQINLMCFIYSPLNYVYLSNYWILLIIGLD
jgi:hypothetical protein